MALDDKIMRKCVKRDMSDMNNDERREELRARYAMERIRDAEENPHKYTGYRGVSESRVLCSSDESYTIQVKDEKGNYIFVKVKNK